MLSRLLVVSSGRGGVSLAACLLVALLGVFVPAEAQAWTEAHVREVDAELTVDASERMRVALDLTLEVRGGWLERLELPGLDEGLVLAEQEPALAVLESGERVPAQVSQRGATLILKFVRRDGLRRGLHHIVVRYDVDSASYSHAQGEGRARFLWTLPGFEAGLLRAALTVRAPQKLSAVDAPEIAQEVSLRDEAAGSVLSFSRLHVPRATPWTIGFELPLSPLRAQQPAVGVEREPLRPALVWRERALLVLSSLLLIALMRRSVSRALARDGVEPRGFHKERPLPLLALVALSLLAAIGVSVAPALAVVSWSLMFVLGVPTALPARGPLALGSFRPLTRADLRTAKHAWWRAMIGVPWADITSVLGAAAAISLLSAAAYRSGLAAFGREPWSLLALCACFGFIASARSLRARSFAEQVAVLVRAAGRARAVSCAFSLVAYASKGRLSQPRLRVLPSARYPGLLRLELLVDTRRSARPLWLSAQVEADSAAERWLSALLPEAQRESAEGGRRVALLVSVDDAGKAAERVLDHLSCESQRALFTSVGNKSAA